MEPRRNFRVALGREGRCARARVIRVNSDDILPFMTADGRLSGRQLHSFIHAVHTVCAHASLRAVNDPYDFRDAVRA